MVTSGGRSGWRRSRATHREAHRGEGRWSEDEQTEARGTTALEHDELERNRESSGLNGRKVQV